MFSQDFSASRQHAWPEFQEFFPLLSKNDRVLDLGCGNGRLRKFIETNLIPEGNYFGFDISEGLLKIARKDHPNDHFFRGDFSETLPFGADNFEVVVSIAAFHHLLTKKEQKALLSEIFRILKPGGKVFLTTWKIPEKHFWKNLRNFSFWKSGWKNYLVPFGRESHPRMYRLVPPKSIAKLAKKAGFSVVSRQLFRGKNWIVVLEKNS